MAMRRSGRVGRKGDKKADAVFSRTVGKFILVGKFDAWKWSTVSPMLAVLAHRAV
jgi:hypothetical protein